MEWIIRLDNSVLDKSRTRPEDYDYVVAMELKAALEADPEMDPTGILHYRLGDAYLNSNGNWSIHSKDYTARGHAAYRTALDKGLHLATLVNAGLLRLPETTHTVKVQSLVTTLSRRQDCYSGHLWQARLWKGEGKYQRALEKLESVTKGYSFAIPIVQQEINIINETIQEMLRKQREEEGQTRQSGRLHTPIYTQPPLYYTYIYITTSLLALSV